MSNVIMSSLHGLLKFFLHLYLLFYRRWYKNVSAVLLLDGAIIIISYRCLR